MRRYILSAIAVVLVTTAAWAQEPTPQAPNPPAQAQAAPKQHGAKVPEGPKPVIEIAEKVKDFGTVSKGEKILATFEAVSYTHLTLPTTPYV